MGGDRTSNVQVLDGSITTDTSETMEFRGASTGSASIVIEGHCGGGVFATIDTLSLTLGTTATVDFGSTTIPFTYVRARVASISGTDATVNVWFGVEV